MGAFAAFRRALTSEFVRAQVGGDVHKLPAERFLGRHGTIGAASHGRVSVKSPCNTACLFCKFPYPTWDVDEQEHGSELLAAVDGIVAAGCRAIVWGSGDYEPTTFSRLPQVMRYARDRGIAQQEVSTNGIRTADPAFLEELEQAGLTELSLSLSVFAVECGRS